MNNQRRPMLDAQVPEASIELVADRHRVLQVVSGGRIERDPDDLDGAPPPRAP
jgi:hypothetical protein